MKNLLFILFLFTGLSVSAQFQDNHRQIVNALNYGCKGDGKVLTDGVINSTTTFTSATAGFVTADAGKLIRITDGGGTGIDLVTTIASVSNSTTVILSNAASASGSAKAFEFGTNNTTAIQAAANAVPASGGAVLYFPLGIYLKNGLTNIPNPCLITGDMTERFGNYDSVSANLNRPHSKIIEVAYNLPQSINIQGMGTVWQNLDWAGTTCKAPTSGVGININASGVSIYNSHIGGTNIWTGVSQNYSAYWVADHTSIFGYQYGLIVRNLQTADAGDWTINDCLFGGDVHTSSSCILVQSSGGMKLTNNKFNVGFHKAISIEILAASSNTSDFQFMNNSIENYDSTAINIIANNSAVFSNIVINGNQIAPYTAHTTGIFINGTGATFLKGISISGNVIYNQQTGDTAIKLIAVQNALVNSNEIYGAWTKQVYIDGTSTNVSYAASTQVAIGTADNGVTGSSNFTSSGTTTSVNDFLKIGSSTNTTAIVPQFQSGFNNNANIADMMIYPSSGTNIGGSLVIVPRGTGFSTSFKSQIVLHGTDAVSSGSNLSFGLIRFGGSANPWQFLSTNTGSGALIPIQFSASGVAGQLTVASQASGGGNVLVNNATDNSTAWLQVTGTTAQLALHYDASNKTIFTTSSTGNETIAPSGGATSITGSLNVSGAQFDNVTLVSATGTYNVTATDYNIVFTGSTAIVVYPTATTGRTLEILNQASGSVTIPTTTTGNGATSTTLTTGQHIRVFYDGTVWRGRIN